MAAPAADAPAPPRRCPAPRSRPPPRRAPAAATIVGYELDRHARRSDDQLQALLRRSSPAGSPFIESGPADQDRHAASARIPRLAQAAGGHRLRGPVSCPTARGRRRAGASWSSTCAPTIGCATSSSRATGRSARTRSSAASRIRPGSPLPPPGPERDAALERERDARHRVPARRGLLRANVRIDAEPGAPCPAPVDLHVSVKRGAGVPARARSTITGNHAISTDEIDPIFRHCDWRNGLGRTGPLHREAAARRHRRASPSATATLGYVGARVTSDFNVQQSVDRNAKNVRLGLTINERKRIAVAFEGNRHKSAGDAEGRADDASSAARTTTSRSAPAPTPSQRYYQQQGFFFARVDWRRERLSDDEERIVFVIDEGPELKVRGIEFVGNAICRRGAGRRRVGADVPVAGRIGLGAAATSPAASSSRTPSASSSDYRAHGFPEAKAHGDAATSPTRWARWARSPPPPRPSSRDAKAIFVRFTIEEGPAVRIDRVDSSESLPARRRAPRPCPTTAQFLLDSLSRCARRALSRRPRSRDDDRRLERLLGDAGYPSATRRARRRAHGRTVGAHLGRSSRAAHARLGPVFVRGNFVTTPQTILEQIPLRSGDYLTTTPVERGQRNLGLLAAVQQRARRSASRASEEQAPTVVPDGGPGRGALRAVQRAARRGRRLDRAEAARFVVPLRRLPARRLREPQPARARLGLHRPARLRHVAVCGATSAFLDRRFFGTLFRFDASLNYLQQATVRLGDIHSGGGSIGFSREMYPGVDAGVHYNLRNTTHTEPLLRAAGPDENLQSDHPAGDDRRQPLGQRRVAASGQPPAADARLPHRRHGRAGAAGALGAAAPAALPDRRRHVPQGRRAFDCRSSRSDALLPAPRLRFDQGFPLGGASLLPKVERYFAGGDTTHPRLQARSRARGGGRVPDLRPRHVDGVEYRPIGGNLRILQNIDLQFPISPPWYGSVFMDNGVVADSLDGLGARASSATASASRRCSSRLPIGDLSFAWAWPLDPGPGDTRIGVFHVNIGSVVLGRFFVWGSLGRRSAGHSLSEGVGASNSGGRGLTPPGGGQRSVRSSWSPSASLLFTILTGGTGPLVFRLASCPRTGRSASTRPRAPKPPPPRARSNSSPTVGLRSIERGWFY